MASRKDHQKKALVALLILIGIGAFVFYWRVGSEETLGDYQIKKGNYRLEDGQLAEAEKEFLLALEKNPDHAAAHLGLALTYMQMDRSADALAQFNRTLELAPEMTAAYADRGILYDRLGQYEKALTDYQKALSLNSEILEGPGWLWRFLHNVEKKPPAVGDRARYLEEELQKPPEERLLKVPEADKKQRMYKVDG
jgi:tetratricopeptide (TPR) repeat protein